MLNSKFHLHLNHDLCEFLIQIYFGFNYYIHIFYQIFVHFHFATHLRLNFGYIFQFLFELIHVLLDGYLDFI